eukprot:97813_1
MKRCPLTLEPSQTALTSNITAMVQNGHVHSLNQSYTNYLSDVNVMVQTEPEFSLNQSYTEYEHSCISHIRNSCHSVPPPSSPSSNSPSISEQSQNIGKDNDNILKQNGYTNIHTLCASQQGELFEAAVLDHEPSNPKSRDQKLVIKKVSKSLHTQHIACPQADDEMTYCIPNNVLKEALILILLTVKNRDRLVCDYLVRFIHFFHSKTHYYLVLEHIEDNVMNLKQFVDKAHQFIQNGKLDSQQYIAVIRFIFWQLFVLFQWMHDAMNCCHLDLKLEHVLLKGARFIVVKEDVSTHVAVLNNR